MFELGSIGGNKLDAAAALRQPPPVIRHHNSPVKNVMRILRRSHSASPAPHTPMEKYLISTMHHNHHHPHGHNDVHHNCNNKNILKDEPRVVNCVEGLPFVMRNKKKVVSFCSFSVRKFYSIVDKLQQLSIFCITFFTWK